MHLLLAVVCVHLTVLGQTDALGHLEEGQTDTLGHLVEKGQKGPMGPLAAMGQTDTLERLVERDPVGSLTEVGHADPLGHLVEKGQRGKIGRLIEDMEKGPLAQLVEERQKDLRGRLVEEGQKGPIGRRVEVRLTDTLGRLVEEGQRGPLGQLVRRQADALRHLQEDVETDTVGHLVEEGLTDPMGHIVEDGQTDALGRLMEEKQTLGHLMIQVKGQSSQDMLTRGKRDTYIVDDHDLATNMMADPAGISTPGSQTGRPRDPGQSTSVLMVDAAKARTRRTVIGRYPMCPRGCTSCSAVNGCVTCERRYFLFLYRRNMRQTGMCTPSCPPGYFGVRQHFHNRCVKCQVSHCRSCFTRQYCTRCYRPRIAHRGDCIDSCPTGLHLANYSSECRSRVDCLVGPWTTWSACRPRGRGCGQRRRFRLRSRNILEAPSPNGGTACPPLRERRGCQGQRRACKDPCRRRKRRKRKWRKKRRKERGRRKGHSRGSDTRKRRRCRSGRKALQRCRRRRHCRGGEG